MPAPAALAGSSAMPPVHGGIVPAVFPARSAPTGVNGPRNASACDAVTAPCAPVAMTRKTIAIRSNRIPGFHVAYTVQHRIPGQDGATAPRSTPREQSQGGLDRVRGLPGSSSMCRRLLVVVAALCTATPISAADVGSVQGFDIRLDTTL